MVKKSVSFLLAVAVLFLSAFPTRTQTIDVEKSGSYPASELRLDLKAVFDAKENKRYASKPFTEQDAKRLEKESLNQQVKRNNLSSTAKIGIGLAIAAAAILTIVLITRSGDDNDPCAPPTIMAPCPPGCFCTQ